MRASISSTFGLPRPPLGEESAVADISLESWKVGRFERRRPVFMKERQELLVVEAIEVVVVAVFVVVVEVVEVDASEAQDDADASESNEACGCIRVVPPPAS
jgi:hypothetical protein